MKILSILPIIPPGIGGCASYSDSLMRAWSGSAVLKRHIVLTEYQRKRPKLEYDSKIWPILPRRRTAEANRNIVHSLLNFFLYRVVIIFVLIFQRMKGVRFLHIHSSISTRLDLLVAKLLGFQITVDVRDLYIKPSNVWLSNAVIACSLAIRDRLVLMGYADKVFYVEIPVDFEGLLELEKKSRLDFGQKIISYIGVISKNKGVPHLIDAFINSKIHKSGGELFLAGPLQEPEIVRKLPSNVKYIGALERSDAVRLISQSSLMVIMGAYEGVPRVAIEAIFMGTPIIIPSGIKEFDSLTENTKSITGLKELSDDQFRDLKVRNFNLIPFEASRVAERTLQIITGQAKQ